MAAYVNIPAAKIAWVDSWFSTVPLPSTLSTLNCPHTSGYTPNYVDAQLKHPCCLGKSTDRNGGFDSKAAVCYCGPGWCCPEYVLRHLNPLVVAHSPSRSLVEVDASPLRVVVVTSHQETPTTPNFRFGHALADSPVAKAHVNHFFRSSPPFIEPKLVRRRSCGQRIKEKAIQISNSFRHALGLPISEL